MDTTAATTSRETPPVCASCVALKRKLNQKKVKIEYGRQTKEELKVLLKEAKERNL